MSREKTAYTKENRNKQKKKGEILEKIKSILEILPNFECQRILDYLSELYLS